MSRCTKFRQVKHSLKSLLGCRYSEAVAEAQAKLTGRRFASIMRIAEKDVDFFPQAAQRRLVKMLGRVGKSFSSELKRTREGASTKAFAVATKRSLAPLAGWGYYRVGEDGRLNLMAKSEHYHAPLGHGFGGYRLIEHARSMGIPNATHNNTRGYIVRMVEQELVRTANGIAAGDAAGLSRVLKSRSASALNRVVNLQTGSLAAETAIKIMLGRFYKIGPDVPEPKYHGRRPVIIVIGDDDAEVTGNYHGTTIFTQMLRGMWPGVCSALDGAGAIKVVAVRPNKIDDVRRLFARYEKGKWKIAGFCHELVMMNYGARMLEKSYIRSCHRLCRDHDVPTFVDEIQSCLWSDELYMFREYGLSPSLVAIGKGFSGGEYAASRILLNGRLDLLPQFGSLVTNGQEELSALAYLVTMAWARRNRTVTRSVGEYYQSRLEDLVRAHRGVLETAEGCRHLSGLRFQDLSVAKRFVKLLVERGIDISVQTYKTGCSPTALTKLPLVAGYEVVDFVIAGMSDALDHMSRCRDLTMVRSE